MRRWTMFAALLAGCYRPSTEATCQVSCAINGLCPDGQHCRTADQMCVRSDDDVCGVADGGRTDTPDGQLCVGNGMLRYCFTAPPTTPFNPPAGEFHTSQAPSACSELIPQANGPMLCVLAFKSVTIANRLRVVGEYPLVLIGVDDLLIEATGIIDASSKATSTLQGANGAENHGCAPPVTLMGMEGTAGGGGAGATFKAIGGGGGAGNATGMWSGGNPSTALVTVDAIRGGCTGGAGADASVNSGGQGGWGGGAVYLMSANKIRVHGTINASGAGGRAGTSTNGGGGAGGSGGFIGLDAPGYELGMGARIFAVGGSGGTGGTPSTDGYDGNEASGPMSPGPTTARNSEGAGGPGGATGNGGDGLVGSYGGGGGGGGSMGFIGIANVPSIISTMTFAPQPVPMN